MSKGILFTALVAVALSLTARAAVWTDDFGGYTVGSDIDEYPDWADSGYSSGPFLVGEYGGDNCIYGDWARYIYLPPGEIEDAAVSFDFLFTGGEAYVCALFRYVPTDRAGYVAFCWNDYNGGPNDYVMFGGASEYGDAFWYPLVSLGDYFEEGVWYHVDASVWGDGDRDYYEIVVNGEMTVYNLIPEGMPDLDSGCCGVIANGFSEPDGVYVDNYSVDDSSPVGIQPTSLGALKAAFK
jgi:hypothetical protein